MENRQKDLAHLDPPYHVTPLPLRLLYISQSFVSLSAELCFRVVSIIYNSYAMVKPFTIAHDIQNLKR